MLHVLALGLALSAVVPAAPVAPPADDAVAAASLRQGLVAMRQSQGLPPLVELPELSRGLVQGARAAAAQDSVRATRASRLPSDTTAHYYLYACPDPSRIPAFVASMARGARRFGAAVTFQRSPSHPRGAYWVALALKDT